MAEGVQRDRVLVAASGKLVCTMITFCLLECGPLASDNFLVTACRADAHGVVERGPVAARLGKRVGKHEPERAIDGSLKAVGTVSVSGHLHSVGRIPSVTEGSLTY